VFEGYRRNHSVALGSIHDKDDTYDWTNAFSTKIAALNSSSFAGYTDWRLPNATELDSLTNRGVVNPTVSGAFNAGCLSGCVPTACSCTPLTNHWSSTTYISSGATSEWAVNFSDGSLFGLNQAIFATVRAVRGGS
jgi:Protein of unknown function (DUF1566)